MNEENTNWKVKIVQRLSKKEIIILLSFAPPIIAFYKTYEHVSDNNELIVLFIFIILSMIPSVIFLLGYTYNSKKDRVINTLQANLKEIVSYKNRSIKKIHEIKAIFKSKNTTDSNDYEKKILELEEIIGNIKMYDGSMPDLGKMNAVSKNAANKAIERRKRRMESK